MANESIEMAEINKPDLEIGGVRFLHQNLAVYLPYSIGTIIVTIVGIAAVAELIVSTLIHPWMVIGMLLGKKFFDVYKNWCVILGTICLICCCTGLITMGFLAFNRYIRIFYFRKYPKIFTLKCTFIMCLISWIFGVLFDMPTIFGSARHVYDQKTLTCTLDRLKVSFMLPAVVIFVFVPVAFVYPMYIRILCYAYRMRLTVREKRLAMCQKTNTTLKAVKIAQNLFFSFLVLVICWIPAVIVIVFGQDDQFPNWIHAFSNLLAHLNAALNPILYLTFNPLIRKSFLHLTSLARGNRTNRINKRP